MALILQVLLAFFQAIPTLEKWAEMVEAKLEEIRKAKADADFSKAENVAQSQKDTCELEKQFDPSKVCSPVPADSVQDSAPKN